MLHARILRKGVFACFEPDLVDARGDFVNAEVSAVVWDGKRLVMASDKDIPGEYRSAVFALDCPDAVPQPNTLRFYTADLIATARKYEDFALTAAGDHLIASTGFDRVDAESTDLHPYNRLLIWPVDAPEAPRLIASREDDGVRSSVGLRDDLAQALGVPYYKVEGLATIPGDGDADPRLLFGSREAGQDHACFDYVCRVVGAPYRMDGDSLVFTGAFEVVYDFDAARWNGVRFDVGLSSLEYDRGNRLLYFLTSFEVVDEAGEPRVGAYLWRIALADFLAGGDPELVAAEDGSAFEFANKAEGVAVLDDGRLFVVYDPDRALELADAHPRDVRRPNEVPYTLLEL